MHKSRPPDFDATDFGRSMERIAHGLNAIAFMTVSVPWPGSLAQMLRAAGIDNVATATYAANASSASIEHERVPIGVAKAIILIDKMYPRKEKEKNA